jgi:16S rRNA (guanine966-N2)-methyltransferase
VPPFDLVFADPPYGHGLGEKALASALEGGWLRPGALAVLEERGDVVVAPTAGFAVLERRDVGDSQVVVMRVG